MRCQCIINNFIFMFIFNFCYVELARNFETTMRVMLMFGSNINSRYLGFTDF